MLSNRLAATGTFFLALFIFAAVAAPVLTPYSPQGTVVSGPLAAPTWVKYIYGDRGLSPNVNFADITAASVGGATLTSSVKGVNPIPVQVSATSGGNLLGQESPNQPSTGRPNRFTGAVTAVPSGPVTNHLTNATLRV